MEERPPTPLDYARAPTHGRVRRWRAGNHALADIVALFLSVPIGLSAIVFVVFGGGGCSFCLAAGLSLPALLFGVLGISEEDADGSRRDPKFAYWAVWILAVAWAASSVSFFFRKFW